jgi:nucleoside-diphosphate-sugar epimerase
MEAYWLCLSKAKNKEVYNIGGDNIISVGDFINELENKLQIKIEKEQSASLVRPVDIKLQIPNCNKFKKDTGWFPIYNAEESINYFLQEIKEYHF